MKLTDLRVAKGWSKAELARKSGIVASDIGKFESGRLRPYPGQLKKLSEALGVELGQDLNVADEGERRP